MKIKYSAVSPCKYKRNVNSRELVIAVFGERERGTMIRRLSRRERERDARASRDDDELCAPRNLKFHHGRMDY